jgi:hypothetical protein
MWRPVMPDAAGTIQQIADLQRLAKPLIRVAAGQIDVLTDQAEEALMAAEAIYSNVLSIWLGQDIAK